MLASLGASFHDVDLATIEQLSDADGLAPALYALSDGPAPAVSGAVVLATCNRFEVYLDLDRFHDGVDAALAAVGQAAGCPVDDVAGLLRVRLGSDAATHLFRVSAGLESMIVGESQIAGQVAHALEHARRAGSVTSDLDLLFQSAAHAAKTVGSETGLHAAGRTIASAALDLAGGAAQGPVLLIGTGAYARVVAAELRARGVDDVLVYSTTGRQERFARDRGLTPIESAKLPQALSACSLVVSCSGRRRVVLTPALVEHALAGRESGLRIVDLALDPDVPADVRRLAGVTVTDLSTVAASGAVDAPSGAVRAAEAVIDGAVVELQGKRADRTVGPAIVALRSHVTGTIDREIERLLPRIPADAADEVLRAAHRIARALLHTPSVRAQEVARDGRAPDYVRAIHTLFGIEIPGDAQAAGDAAAPPSSARDSIARV